MQNKVTSQTNSVIVNGNEYPKNTLVIMAQDKVKVGIKTIHNNVLIDPVHFSEYLTGASAPYADQATLITDLRTALFAAQA